MIAKTAFGALLGATVGIGLHLLLAPVLGGTCHILCDPYRAVVAGAILIGFLAFMLGRAGRKKAGQEKQGSHS